MRVIFVSRAEFEDFRDVQIRPRADWPATFSCNQYGQVWPFGSYGHTPEGERLYLQRQISKLDEIVAIVLAERPEGGRFFLRDDGVFVRPGESDIRIALLLSP